jgi:hypothetical protein
VGDNKTEDKKVKQIKLSQGKTASVDDEDFPSLNQFKWYALKSGRTFYAVRLLPRVPDEIRKTVRMHRIINETPDGFETDHIDGNGLNNQRSNLRTVTTRGNGQNRHVPKTSSFPGVSFRPRTKNPWRAQYSLDGKVMNIGHFPTEELAHEAYLEKVGEKI